MPPMNGVSSGQTGGRLARPALWSALAVVTAILVTFQVFHRRPSPARLEVDRSDLVLREKRLYRRGEARPFSGAMLEHHPNGSLRSRSLIANGVLHGLSEGWHTNGQLQVRESFQGSVSHGLRTKWHPNGSKWSEVMIVHGKWKASSSAGMKMERWPSACGCAAANRTAWPNPFTPAASSKPVPRCARDARSRKNIGRTGNERRMLQSAKPTELWQAQRHVAERSADIAVRASLLSSLSAVLGGRGAAPAGILRIRMSALREK